MEDKRLKAHYHLPVSLEQFGKQGQLLLRFFDVWMMSPCFFV
jgi:hypothetical protein